MRLTSALVTSCLVFTTFVVGGCKFGSGSGRSGADHNHSSQGHHHQPARASKLPDLPPRPVNVRIAFDYRNFAAQIELYDLKPDFRFDVSQTRIVSSLKEAPVTIPLSPDLIIKNGESRSFALVIKNESRQTLFFFASPHVVSPDQAAVAHRFECLCNQQVFQIPPGKIWYRIVRLDLEASFPEPALELKHAVIGLTQKQVEEQYKGALYD